MAFGPAPSSFCLTSQRQRRRLAVMRQFGEPIPGAPQLAAAGCCPWRLNERNVEESKMNSLTPESFRSMYQKMLNQITDSRGCLRIKSKSNDSYIIITKWNSDGKRFIPGVMVWHQYNHDAVDLLFDGDRKDIVGGKIPPDARDISDGNTSWLQYRWPVSRIDIAVSPFEQDGAKEAMQRAVWAFRWVAENRVDRSG